ncbi:MAG: hypothetical protein ABI604_06825 [Nitrospirota bacterium]
MSKQHRVMGFVAILFRLVNRVLAWYRLLFLPLPIHLLSAASPQILNLPALRHDLRRWNLHDTRTLPTVVDEKGKKPVCPFHARDLEGRREDGTHNDLADPTMGSAGTRFGRTSPWRRAGRTRMR